MTSALAYLSRLCRRWGGELFLLPKPEFLCAARCSGHSTHPSGSHAIDRGSRLVLASSLDVNPGTIIHEMGHAFLDEGDPSNTYEPDWLGWEIALARCAGCFREWSAQNAGYTFMFDGAEREWSELSPDEARRFIAERIDYAMELGIVSRRGEPQCTRPMR